MVLVLSDAGSSKNFRAPDVKQSPPLSIQTQALPPPPELQSPPNSASFPPPELQRPPLSETQEVSLDKVPYPTPPPVQITKVDLYHNSFQVLIERLSMLVFLLNMSLCSVWLSSRSKSVRQCF